MCKIKSGVPILDPSAGKGDLLDRCKTIEGTLTETWKNISTLEDWVCESEFFKIRFFKKGTLHLTFLDEWLWKEFNYQAAKGKNWLPDGDR